MSGSNNIKKRNIEITKRIFDTVCFKTLVIKSTLRKAPKKDV